MTGFLFGVVIGLFFVAGAYLTITNGTGVCQP